MNTKRVAATVLVPLAMVGAAVVGAMLPKWVVNLILLIGVPTLVGWVVWTDPKWGDE